MVVRKVLFKMVRLANGPIPGIIYASLSRELIYLADFTVGGTAVLVYSAMAERAIRSFFC